MSDFIDPYILNNILKYVEDKYLLSDIIDEYERDLDLDAEFKDEIKICYNFATQHMKLRDYQKDCIREALEYYHNSKKNVNYQIRWCCGLGKTRTACSILKLGDFKTIYIGLPSILLLEQFSQEIEQFYPDINILKVGSGISQEGDCNFKKITSKEISRYLKSDYEYKIILSTYHSSKKIMEEGFKFDICVADEAHHLESKSQKLFSNFLKIECQKKLLLSATPNLKLETNSLLSFDNSNVFKGMFNTKSVKWAINKRFISDYRIVILNLIKLDIKDFDKLYQNYNNVNLIITAFSAVKAIYQGISKKILIYCNRVKNAQEIENIIDELLDIYNCTKCSVNPNGLDLEIVNFELNGSNSQKERNKVMRLFKTSDFGIISSVQLFGEGFDYPGLDTVIFAEKMTSDIRIIQSGLRPCRKDYNNPKKIANIIIPIQDGDISKPKQVLSKLKEIDNIRGKISLVDSKHFNNRGIIKFIKSSKSSNISYPLETILRKIEFEILENRLELEDDIKIPDMTCSEIEMCQVNYKKFKNKKECKYNPILIHIYQIIYDTLGKDELKKQTVLRITETKLNRVRGYVWHESLGISVQGYDSNHTLKEIIRLCIINKIELKITTKLKNSLTKKITVKKGIYKLTD